MAMLASFPSSSFPLKAVHSQQKDYFEDVEEDAREKWMSCYNPLNGRRTIIFKVPTINLFQQFEKGTSTICKWVKSQEKKCQRNLKQHQKSLNS